MKRTLYTWVSSRGCGSTTSYGFWSPSQTGGWKKVPEPLPLPFISEVAYLHCYQISTYHTCMKKWYLERLSANTMVFSHQEVTISSVLTKTRVCYYFRKFFKVRVKRQSSCITLDQEEKTDEHKQYIHPSSLSEKCMEKFGHQTSRLQEAPTQK